MAKNIKKNSQNKFISNTTAFNNYSKGCNLATSGFWLLLAVVVIYSLIGFFSDGKVIESLLNIPWILAIIVSIIFGFFIVGPIKMSSSWVFLKAARKEEYKIKNMFAVFNRNYWNAVLAGFLSVIFIILGFIFFIIPGIIVLIRLVFVKYLIIDKKMKAWDAITTSWNMTRGYSWTILAMGLIAIPLIIAGLICLIIGIFPIIMWLESSFAVLYYSVSLKKS
ncbi:hypothetical protein CMI49_01580 [Candidatus Pacearchaeota archaeon]|jgi:uncharacterized membrane protein|nr:hypothetical protein [Candidatus Pacearchaeota archaeon]|tara:strand:+ start:2625 stop:3290 length:666 start_codon:yes stop_codon:yes gene_type:complete